VLAVVIPGCTAHVHSLFCYVCFLC
jgi:hypothetical protein